MASSQRARIGASGPTAAFIRLVAFIVAAVGAVTIPATLVATTAGHVTHQSALYMIVGAGVLILTALVAVRPFDPLRG